MTKKLGLLEAARLIDARVAVLEAELERDKGVEFISDESRARDRAAIAEAKHCARLIRSLASEPYRAGAQCPYRLAMARAGRLPG